jgi:DNA-directed RNA polymerase subunit M/transcription elongation factor TFIIS
MATGINDHLYYNETDECGICSELLVDPRGLPCRPHTFCFKCLTDLIEHARQDYGTSFKCPLCRREYPISDSSLSSEEIADKFPEKVLRRRTLQTNSEYKKKIKKLKKEYQNLMKNVGDLLTDEYKINEAQMIKAITMSRIDEYETKLGKFYQDALLQIHNWKLDLGKCKSLKVQRYAPAIRVLLDDTTVYNSDVDAVNTSSENVSERWADLEEVYKTLNSRYDEIKQKIEVSSKSIFQPNIAINKLLAVRKQSFGKLNTDDFERDDIRLPAIRTNRRLSRRGRPPREFTPR